MCLSDDSAISFYRQQFNHFVNTNKDIARTNHPAHWRLIASSLFSFFVRRNSLVNKDLSVCDRFDWLFAYRLDTLTKPAIFHTIAFGLSGKLSETDLEWVKFRWNFKFAVFERILNIYFLSMRIIVAKRNYLFLFDLNHWISKKKTIFE